LLGGAPRWPLASGIFAISAVPSGASSVALIRLRGTHPAFGGHLEVTAPTEPTLRMSWALADDSCVLEADLASGKATIKGRQNGRELDFAP
jgi:hypothetical protein